MRKKVLSVIMAVAAVAIGLAILSAYLTRNVPTPQPPVMTILADGGQYVTGIGPYSGTFPNGTGYGMEVDSSVTLPEESFELAAGSEIEFSPESPERTQLRESWIRDEDSGNQVFLERVDDFRFRLPDDVPAGDYIMTIRAVYDDTLVTQASYNHKVEVS